MLLWCRESREISARFTSPNPFVLKMKSSPGLLGLRKQATLFLAIKLLGMWIFLSTGNFVNLINGQIEFICLPLILPKHCRVNVYFNLFKLILWTKTLDFHESYTVILADWVNIVPMYVYIIHLCVQVETYKRILFRVLN